MKTKIFALAILAVLHSCKSGQTSKNQHEIHTTIDLINVYNDKVNVSIDFPRITNSTVEFCLPKTVPGTYSNDNYGRFIDDFKAIDYQGNEIQTKRLDENRWEISSAQKLDKVTYKVNDTYDFENEGGVFSPTGTNIDKDKNYLLNLHGFIGYLKNHQDLPHKLEIKRPQFMYAATALSLSSKKSENNYEIDEFNLPRYFEVTDNPIMYSKPDTLSFKTSGMEILLSLYSANGKYKANDFRDALVKTMVAQKNFLGKIDDTKKYAILMYLSDDNKPDARGSGALEHNQSTVVNFSESMPKESLEKYLVDVVSHEFFHILTPLNVHSKEIHYFDYNNPKMSQHLWMYEGVTEYFANLFQINQKIIDEKDFYKRMSDKINVSKGFDDHLPFTYMSENILKDEYQDSFYNVYQKGALIGMCIDIQLREMSDGKSGLLDLMRNLSAKYGKNKPFDDHKIINEITTMTDPKLGEFFKQYVQGNQPIPYEKFLEKVGLELKIKEEKTDYFFNKNTPYIDFNKKDEIVFRKTLLNSFLEKIGVKNGDVLKAINGESISKQSYKEPILATKNWKTGLDVSLLVERNGKEILLKGKTTQPITKIWEIVDKMPKPNSKEYLLRKSWLIK